MCKNDKAIYSAVFRIDDLENNQYKSTVFCITATNVEHYLNVYTVYEAICAIFWPLGAIQKLHKQNLVPLLPPN